MVLRASDVDGQFSETIVKVTVNDINDNNPRFDSLQESPVHVLENISPGHVITRMNASDLDLGVNGQVLFHIQNGSFDKFRINARTGMLPKIAENFVKCFINFFHRINHPCTWKVPGPRITIHVPLVRSCVRPGDSKNKIKHSSTHCDDR